MTGAEMIAAERRRQIEEEGWSAEHDDEHATDTLICAALSYGLDVLDITDYMGDARLSAYMSDILWPWDVRW